MILNILNTFFDFGILFLNNFLILYIFSIIFKEYSFHKYFLLLFFNLRNGEKINNGPNAIKSLLEKEYAWCKILNVIYYYAKSSLFESNWN